MANLSGVDGAIRKFQVLCAQQGARCQASLSGSLGVSSFHADIPLSSVSLFQQKVLEFAKQFGVISHVAVTPSGKSGHRIFIVDFHSPGLSCLSCQHAEYFEDIPASPIPSARYGWRPPPPRARRPPPPPPRHRHHPSLFDILLRRLLHTSPITVTVNTSSARLPPPPPPRLDIAAGDLLVMCEARGYPCSRIDDGLVVQMRAIPPRVREDINSMAGRVAVANRLHFGIDVEPGGLLVRFYA
jgi:hypothetical protein